jgi:hypothetical protein
MICPQSTGGSSLPVPYDIGDIPPGLPKVGSSPYFFERAQVVDEVPPDSPNLRSSSRLEVFQNGVDQDLSGVYGIKGSKCQKIL